MKKIAICFLALLLANQVVAQEQWTSKSEGELENSQVVIEKNRKIELPNTQRSFLKVPQLKTSSDSIAVNFNWEEVTPELSSVNPNLRVLRIKDDPLEKLFANQVSAGLGNYGATYLSAFLANKRDKHKSYGLQLYHKNYNKGSVDDKYSASGYQLVRPYLRLINKAFVFSSDVSYERSNNYAYGVYEALGDGNELLDRKDYQKMYQNVSANVSLEDRNIDDKITYDISLHANHLFTNFNSDESVVSYRINNNYSLSKTIGFGMPINGFFSQYNSSNQALSISQKDNRYFYRFQPNFTYVLDQVTLLAGLNIVGENDKLENMGKLHIYPRIEAAYRPISKLVLKAGLSGDVEEKLYKDFIQENPYLDLIFLNSVLRPFIFNIGINSDLFDRLYLSSNLSIAAVHHQYFYSNLTLGVYRPSDYITSPYFVSEHLTETKAELGMQLNINKFIDFKASGSYLTYSHDSIDVFPNTPKFRYQFGTDINIQDKLEISLNAYGQSESVAIENNSLGDIFDPLNYQPYVDIDGFIDLGITAKYNLSTRSTVFIDTKNLIAKEYRTYANYPGRGFQIMAGFTYSF